MNNLLFYNNGIVLNNLVKQMMFRNSCFLNPVQSTGMTVESPTVQGIVVNRVDNLLSNFRRFKFFERFYNIYASVARYNFTEMNTDIGIPPLSFNLEKRRIERKKYFANLQKYMCAYDFVLDFDVKNFDDTYNDVKLIKNQFDLRAIPYQLVFSGRGFYIIVPSKYYFDETQNNVEICEKMARKLRTLYKAESIDLGIYDAMRIIKCQYTIDIKTGNACMPLSDAAFLHFKPENMRAEAAYQKFMNYEYNFASIREGKSDAFRIFMKNLGVL